MFRILIDTCVWLDLAKDYRQRALLGALEELIRHGEVSLIIPRVIVDEVSRNKARIIEESNRSLSGSLKRVKEAVDKYGEALRRVQPELLADLMIEQEWIEQPRRFTEIIAAIDELFDKVWYNRHMIWREKIEAGKIKIVEKESFPVRDHSTRPIQRDVWEGALKAAARKEKSTVRKISVRGMILSGAC